jgi:hypothetical protein
LIPRALDLLARAVAAGIPAADAAADPDFRSVHNSAEFKRLCSRPAIR